MFYTTPLQHYIWTKGKYMRVLTLVEGANTVRRFVGKIDGEETLDEIQARGDDEALLKVVMETGGRASWEYLHHFTRLRKEMDKFKYNAEKAGFTAFGVLQYPNA